MMTFKNEWLRHKKRIWFEQKSTEQKREFLSQFEMEDNVRLLVEYEKITDYTLCVVFDRLCRIDEPLQQIG